MALARVRQLSAHEVGHTLGFPHNYIASTYGRESVMDYPAPYVEIDGDGDLDLSNAYVQRIGEYDKLSVNWLYREFPEGDRRGRRPGAGRHGGPPRRTSLHGAHEQQLHRCGAPLRECLGQRVQPGGPPETRDPGTEHRGSRNSAKMCIGTGRPLSDLEYVLLPLYMHHRFQLRSAAQSLGGADYSYAVRGDGQTPVSIVPGEEQRDALETILSAMTVDFLALPEEVVAMIPPPAFRHSEGRDLCGAHRGALRPVGHRRRPPPTSPWARSCIRRGWPALLCTGSMGDYPDLEEVTDRLLAATWGAADEGDEYRLRVQHVIQRAVVDRMMQQAGSAGTMTEARAVLSDRLHDLAGRLEALMNPSPHGRLVAADIRRWQARIENTTPGPSLQLPAGDPIGGSKRGGGR